MSLAAGTDRTPRLRHALLGFVMLTVGYIAVLVVADVRNPTLARGAEVVALLPAMAAMSALGYLARYLRWRRLLARAGHVTAFVAGLLAYLSGFAFTATPGKVGELVRMRYLTPRGVPAPVVFGAFVFERVLDLLVVMCLALLAVGDPRLMAMSIAFVGCFAGGVVTVAAMPGAIGVVQRWLGRRGWSRAARLAGGLHDALVGCRRWLNVGDVSAGAGYGLLAWGLTAASFVWLLHGMGLAVPPLEAFALYPLAMLAGAASMLPGGVGSTELAIVTLLARHEVALETAALAAVGVRLSTLWFSILCGLVSIAVLEAAALRRADPTVRDAKEPAGTDR
jgi:uncharacterized membrane protein YbhN (UPF0104 family)